jgi:hypothetical protein
VHGLIEYAVGVLFIVAPFLFSFDKNSATAASIVVGLALLAFTAVSDLPTGLVRNISVGVHVTADVVLAVLLVALPFVLGFRDEDENAPTALFITVGVLHLLLTIATRFRSADDDDSDDGLDGLDEAHA